MTFAELIQYLDANTDFSILDGDAAATFEKASGGTHADPIIGEILKAIIEGNDCTESGCALERAGVVTAIGPLRLKYMADDAPVEGFRAVEGIIQTVDSAFNEEALRLKQGG